MCCHSWNVRPMSIPVCSVQCEDKRIKLIYYNLITRHCKYYNMCNYLHQSSHSYIILNCLIWLSCMIELQLPIAAQCICWPVGTGEQRRETQSSSTKGKECWPDITFDDSQIILWGQYLNIIAYTLMLFLLF